MRKPMKGCGQKEKRQDGQNTKIFKNLTKTSLMKAIFVRFLKILVQLSVLKYTLFVEVVRYGDTVDVVVRV